MCLIDDAHCSSERSQSLEHFPKKFISLQPTFSFWAEKFKQRAYSIPLIIINNVSSKILDVIISAKKLIILAPEIMNFFAIVTVHPKTEMQKIGF